MCTRLQPCVREAATTRARGCNHACARLHPYVREVVRLHVLGGASVWVDWPHCREARVVCASCSTSRHWRDRRGAEARCDILFLGSSPLV